MKKLLAIPIALMLLNCGSSMSLSETSESTKEVAQCPEKGNCTIEVLKNKTLLTKTDGTGALYYKISDSNITSVIKYTYTKDSNPAIQDAGYREEIIFEVENNWTILSIRIQKCKTLKFCLEYTAFAKVKPVIIE